MQKITEDMNIQDAWYAEARSMTRDNLSIFIRRLLEDYEHDYGTICHALTAGAIATASAMNKTPQGGITGFQASMVMWKFVQEFMQFKGPLSLTKWEDALYPQNERHFAIPASTWEWLQAEAQKRLSDGTPMATRVRAHMESIVAGKVPFGLQVEQKKG